MNAVLDTVEDGQLLYLSPDEIEVIEGFNPRSYFDTKAQEALEASIREHGIQQNLVVRPDPERPGRYLLIAGERRLRAARALGLEEVPCLVRQVDARQALAIAALENEKRENLSPSEEARQARRMLDACDGDRDEACRVLGWSHTKLDARLLLLHAHESVLDALAQRKIRLGIAELLSTLPKPAQEKNLPIVIEKGYSVPELRSRLESMAQKLSRAIFDTAGCRGCPHNSTTQASLFDDALSEGQCMGRSCYAEKTRKALEQKKQALAEAYNVVFLDVEKEPGSWAYLLRDGEDGVGAAQHAACMGCANYGALLSSEPGQEGEVKEGVCFDPLCMAGKVKAHRKALAEASKAPKAASGKGKGEAGKTKKPSSKKKGTAEATPKRVQEQVVDFLRAQAAEVGLKDPATRRALLLRALIEAVRLEDEALEPGNGAQTFARLHELPDEALGRLEARAVEKLLRDHEDLYGGQNGAAVRTAYAVLAVTDTDLRGRFRLTREFLKAHTKAGIEALMREATDPQGRTFVEWYEAQEGKPLFKKLMSRKTEEIIDTILDSGFDFSQWVPTCITREIDTMRKEIGKAASQ